MPRAAPVTTACGEFGSPAMGDSPRMCFFLPDRIYFILQALANESGQQAAGDTRAGRWNGKIKRQIYLAGRAPIATGTICGGLCAAAGMLPVTVATFGEMERHCSAPS